MTLSTLSVFFRRVSLSLWIVEAISNKGISTRSKDATRGAPGMTTSNKKQLLWTNC